MNRLLIVAASAIARAGLTALIVEQTQAWEITSVATLQEALLEAHDPALKAVLWDLSAQGIDPDLDFDGITRLKALAIVALVGENPEISVGVLLQAGVQSVLPGDTTVTEILAALDATLAGLVTLHPAFVEELVDQLPHSLPVISTEPDPALTPREIEVLTRLAQGASNKAIAHELIISEHTVKFHLSAIFAKLGVSTRTEAAMVGARLGLIML